MNYALGILHLNSRYLAFEIDEHSLGPAVNSLRILGFRGANATVPFKSSIIDFLDEVDEEAQQIGAVNCIANRSGKLIGYNTDHLGFNKPLQDRIQALRDKNALVIGSGGAARAVVYALVRDEISELTIANRTESNAQALIRWCNDALHYKGVHFAGDSRNIPQDRMGSFDIVVNTTPLGMTPHIADCPVGEEISFREGQIIYDLVYNPFETEFLRRARESGALTLNGLEMLVIQGLYSLVHWFPSEQKSIFSLQNRIIGYAKRTAGKR